MSTLIHSSIDSLRAAVRAGAQNRPGVYRMFGGNEVIIYIGKSKRVRTRLLGYFRAKESEKAWRIVREARRVEWEYAPSEFASLLLELDLIKKHRPPYNVRQKRDGLYSYLKLSPGAAPRLHVVRRLGDDAGTHFGPFRGGERIVEAVRELNDILQLRDCRSEMPIHYSDQRDLFDVELTPGCARYELRRCMAPCAARCSEAEYSARIEQAGRFLTGDADEPLRALAERMEAASARWEFEHAAALRNRISRLEMLRAEFLRLREALDGLTFFYAVPGFDADHRIYAIRAGSIRGTYPAPRTARQRGRLLEQASDHLTRPEPRSDTAGRARVEQILLVAHWFRTRPSELARAYGPTNWSKLPLARQLDRASVA